jgi:hypothetical protein
MSQLRKYTGGVLLPDGRVVFVPAYSGNIGIFELIDPIALTFKFTAITQYSLTNNTCLFKGGVLLENGSVLFVPFNAKSIGIYDAVNNIYNPIVNANTIYFPNEAFSGGILLPDGRVVFVPYKMPSVVIYDIYNNEIITNATLVNNGLTYIYQPNNLITPSGNGDYQSGTLLFDGRILLSPMYAKNIGIITGNNIPPPKEFCLHPFFNRF